MNGGDRHIWNQLSDQAIRLQILKDFCFPDFMKKFHRLFQIRPKHQYN